MAVYLPIIMVKWKITLYGDEVWHTDGVPDRFDTLEDAIEAIQDTAREFRVPEWYFEDYKIERVENET